MTSTLPRTETTPLAADPSAPYPDAPDLAGLRILAFCDYFSPVSAGGSERVAAEVYQRMAAWGARITVVGGLPSALVCDRPPEWAAGVEVVAVRARDLSPLVGAQVSVSAALFRDAGRAQRRVQPDVITAQSIHFQSSAVAAAVQRRSKTPLVTTVHVAGLDDMPLSIRLPTAAYEASVGRFILGRSHRVIAVSDAVRGHLASKVDGDRLVVVGNGVDHARFSPPVTASAREVPTVVFVGRLIANKGPHHLLEALGQVRDRNVKFSAVFIGDGPLRASLVARAAALGIADVVRFTGAVKDVPDRLRGADVFVRPSLTEGMSLALLEAMASGVCPVVSEIPANAHVVTHGVSGMLCPVADPSRLADALVQVLSDRRLRERLAGGAVSRAAQHSWDRCARETAEVLVDAVGAARAGR